MMRYKTTDQDVICPFCDNRGFDLYGLQLHLEVGNCKVYRKYPYNTKEELMVDYSAREPFTRHGGPYDRGLADAYKGRAFVPHYYTGPTYASDLIEEIDMTDEEVDAYTQGFNDNE